jgi:hypothetical protein
MHAPDTRGRVWLARPDRLDWAAARGDGVKTTRERAEEKRAEKLERVREQVESGSLVIRQMTDEERRRARDAGLA